jgi:hypothetical protein
MNEIPPALRCTACMVAVVDLALAIQQAIWCKCKQTLFVLTMIEGELVAVTDRSTVEFVHNVRNRSSLQSSAAHMMDLTISMSLCSASGRAYSSGMYVLLASSYMYHTSGD